jgi:hypothetical protein
MSTANPNVYGCHDPQCLDYTWDHECPTVPRPITFVGVEAAQARIAELNARYGATADGSLSPQDWKTIFSTVPPYPMDLPDELRRTIAQLAIDIREAAEHMERGRRIGSTLDYQMPMSLISGGLRRMEKYAP